MKTCNLTSVFRAFPLWIIEVSWNCYDGTINFLTCKLLSHLLQFHEDESGNLLGIETLCLTFKIDFNLWLIIAVIHNFEGPCFNVFLDTFVIKIQTNQTLYIINSVLDIFMRLLNSDLPYEDFLLFEWNPRGNSSLVVILFDDFNFIIHVDTDTRESCAEVDTDWVHIWVAFDHEAKVRNAKDELLLLIKLDSK